MGVGVPIGVRAEVVAGACLDTEVGTSDGISVALGSIVDVGARCTCA